MARVWSTMVMVALASLSGCASDDVAWWDGCIDVLDALEANWRGDIAEACSVTSREVDLPATLSMGQVDACLADVEAGMCGSQHVCGANANCSRACDEIRVFEALATKDTAGYSQADVICGR